MRIVRPIGQASGFVLPWIILTLAIIAVLAATVAPTLASYSDRTRAVNAAAQLKLVANGFVAYEQALRNYPGRVSALTIAITTSDKNSCGRNVGRPDANNWPDNAPYAPFYTGANGMWTDIGRVRDSVPLRNPPARRQPIYVELPGVSGEDAAMLHLVVDNGTGDTVTFAAPVNDTTTVRYRVLSTNDVANNRC
ncbi:MAG: type II secretion system protein [Gemmatimonadaceae bacterium]